MAHPKPPPDERWRADVSRLDVVGAKLLRYEEYWRDRFHFFAARGYTLRPRYDPDWVPSWQSQPDRVPLMFEDFFESRSGHIMDATRKEDSRMVCIKRLPSNSQELEISLFFSQPHLRSDPRNHCIPVFDSFQDEKDEGVSYMVMPFLRRMDDPPFEIVGDVVDFADQVIEGLAFMHENYIAHRDCAPSNIFMDASPLFPRGFHPVIASKTRDFSTRAPRVSRSDATEPIKYYLADFDLSVRIPAGAPRRVLGAYGADKEVPELSETVPYDPFKTDVFILGNALRKQLHDKYFRLEFLRPLILTMTKRNPDDRPSAEAALSQWRQIRRHITAFQRVCRLRGRDEGIVTALVSDIISFFKVSFIISRRLMRWSLDWIALILA